jgi:hypothetical protein
VVASASARQRLYYDGPSCVLTAVEVEEDEMRMVSRRLSLARGGVEMASVMVPYCGRQALVVADV